MNKRVDSRSVSIEIACGDQLDEIRKLGQIVYIKIDVEGHEFFVLLGLRRMIAKHLPPVFFECNDAQEFAELSRIFPGCYSFYRFAGDKNLAQIFAVSGYRLIPLIADSVPPAPCNILAWPSIELPTHIANHVLP